MTGMIQPELPKYKEDIDTVSLIMILYLFCLSTPRAIDFLRDVFSYFNIISIFLDFFFICEERNMWDGFARAAPGAI